MTEYRLQHENKETTTHELIIKIMPTGMKQDRIRKIAISLQKTNKTHVL